MPDEKKKKLLLRAEEFKKIHTDPYGDELMREPEIRPYVDFFRAQLQQDVSLRERAAQEIKNLPLELRYTARIIRALQWGFADFDSENIRIDKELGFSESDLPQLDQYHFLRARQFCLFLRALCGTEKMKRIMAEAVEYAEQP